MTLPDGKGQAGVTHGLGTREPSNEQCYILDADFFDDQRSEYHNLIRGLDFLNEQSGLFFRWCVTERLREAMVLRPQPK
jgi:uncharacterized protein (TIGR04255 family)